MFNKFIFFLFLTFFAFSGITSAATIKVGEQVIIRMGDVVRDNLYLVAGDVSTEEVVFGDLMAVGGNVRALENISGDVFLLGGNVTLLGSTDGDVRIVGGNITVNGNISGDLVIVGGTVSILPTATIGKDVVVAGGVVSLGGTINRNVKVAGGIVTISANIKGDVDVRPDEKFILSEGAVIHGSLSYSTHEDLTLSIDGDVLGAIDVLQVDGSINHGTRESLAKFFSLIAIVKFCILLISGLLLVLIFKKFSINVSTYALENNSASLITGLVLLFIVPITAVIFFATFIGVLFGLLTVLVYVSLLILSTVYANIIVGTWLRRLIERKKDIVLDWKTVLLGTTSLFLITLIPFLGWFIAFYFLLISIGSIGRLLHSHLWLKR